MSFNQKESRDSSSIQHIIADYSEAGEEIGSMSQKSWYHATTLDAYKAIKKYGVQADYNLGNELDFGYGFYLTSSLEEAAEFILRMKKETEKLELEDIPSEEYAPIVIEFELPFNLFQAIDEGCKVKVFTAEDPEFYDFVFHNRLRNKYGEDHHEFDLVYGDMANSNPLALMIDYRIGKLTEEEVKKEFRKYSNFKQLSIHRQEICDKLKIIKLYEAATRRELNLDD